MLRCPVCRSPLARQGKRYRCVRGHSFDVARSGYVNLLRSGSAHSRGDALAMVRSRRAFLEAGHYRPLLEELKRRVPRSHLAQDGVRSLLDVGCGEGYFTAGLAEAIPGWEVWGIDISRDAVDLAARRHPEVNFAVAAARDLPILDASVDVAVSTFGPHEPGELRRVLRPRGRLLVASPGAAHLVELRRMLYRDVRPPGHQAVEDLRAGWTLIDRAELRYVLKLDLGERGALLAMTPYAWAGSEDSRRAVLDLPTITAHFVITELMPTA